jgi:hypothetical protein
LHDPKFRRGSILSFPCTSARVPQRITLLALFFRLPPLRGAFIKVA